MPATSDLLPFQLLPPAASCPHTHTHSCNTHTHKHSCNTHTNTHRYTHEICKQFSIKNQFYASTATKCQTAVVVVVAAARRGWGGPRNAQISQSSLLPPWPLFGFQWAKAGKIVLGRILRNSLQVASPEKLCQLSKDLMHAFCCIHWEKIMNKIVCFTTFYELLLYW